MKMILEKLWGLNDKMNLTLRLAERLIFRQFFLPALPKTLFYYQFALHPSDSTTAALTFVLHHVTRLLEDNLNVRCVFIDYSRTFDTINHEILIRKLMSFAIPPNVIKWIASFLSGQTPAVSSDGKLSCWLPVTQSIAQGSGIGRFLYIIFCFRFEVIVSTESAV
jgi:Reverse transcriptase (RNA-dependent DNA polymerase)